MKKYITHTLLSFATVLGLVGFVGQPAGAIDVFTGACGGSQSGSSGQSGQQGGGNTASGNICGATTKDDAKTIIKNIINTMLFIVGILGVISIIIGGMRYILSNGDPGQLKTAKDIILYATIGIIVAIMAFAIVNFVITNVGGGGGGTTT